MTVRNRLRRKLTVWHVDAHFRVSYRFASNLAGGNCERFGLGAIENNTSTNTVTLFGSSTLYTKGLENVGTYSHKAWYRVNNKKLVSSGDKIAKRDFLHILAYPGYAPGTIAVNITWLERGFNACQTHHCMYPFIFNRLWAVARYWSEIATFSYPLAFNAPVGVIPWTIFVIFDGWVAGWPGCNMVQKYAGKVKPPESWV